MTIDRLLLQRITLQNFGIHRENTVVFNPNVTRLCGRRGSGKTTIFRALSACFVGANVLTTEDGRGLNQQVTTGAEVFSLLARFASSTAPRTPSQSILRELQAAGGQVLTLKGAECGSGIKEQQAAILAQLGCRKEILRAVLDIRPIFDRSLDEQRAEIMTVVQPSGEGIPLAERDGKLIVKHCGYDASEIVTLGSLAEMATLYKQCFDKRTKANGTLKRIVLPAEPTERPPEREEYYRDYERKAGASLVKWAGECGRLQGRITEAGKPTPERPVFEKPTRSKELAQKRVDEFRSEFATLQEKRRAADAEKRRLEEILQSVDDGKVKCPHCGHKINKKDRDAHKASIETDVAALKLALASITSDLTKCQETVAVETGVLQAVTEEWRKYDASQAPVSERAPVDIEALKAELVEAEKAQSKAETNQQKAREYATLARAEAEYDAKYKELKSAQVDAEELSILCEVLGPKGLRIQLFEQWAKPFLEALREAAEPFNLDCSLTEEDGLMVNGRGPAHLSDGDKLLFEMCYRYAMAVHSGLRVMVFDINRPLGQTEIDQLWAHLEALAAKDIQIVATHTVDAPMPGVVWFEASPDGKSTSVTVIPGDL